MARLPPAARRHLDAGGHQLRRLVARGDRGLGLPLRGGRHRVPPPAHRAHARRVARPAPRRAGGAAVRLPDRRPVGPAARAALQPRQAAARSVLPGRSPGEVRHGPELLTHDDPAHPHGDRSERDSAASMPRSVVVHDDFDWEGDTQLHTWWRDTVVYELHVKGYTQLHNEIPEHQRGTYAGLGSPTVTRYLQDLGVTAVELLPVHQSETEPHVAGPRDAQLLGLQLRRLLRAARRLQLDGRPGTAGHRVQADGQGPAPGRDRGDPRRRLQPHRRGGGGRADVQLPRARRRRLLQAAHTRPETPTGT